MVEVWSPGMVMSLYEKNLFSLLSVWDTRQPDFSFLASQVQALCSKLASCRLVWWDIRPANIVVNNPYGAPRTEGGPDVRFIDLDPTFLAYFPPGSGQLGTEALADMTFLMFLVNCGVAKEDASALQKDEFRAALRAKRGQFKDRLSTAAEKVGELINNTYELLQKVRLDKKKARRDPCVTPDRCFVYYNKGEEWYNKTYLKWIESLSQLQRDIRVENLRKSVEWWAGLNSPDEKAPWTPP